MGNCEAIRGIEINRDVDVDDENVATCRILENRGCKECIVMHREIELNRIVDIILI